MEGPALDGGDPLAHHRLAAVDELGLHRAVLQRDGRDVGRVGLVGLGQVGGVGVDGEPLLGEPGHRAAGVEAAGEGDAECGALRGKRLVDAAHGLATYHRRSFHAQPRTPLQGAGRTRPAPGGPCSPTSLPLGAASEAEWRARIEAGQVRVDGAGRGGPAAPRRAAARPGSGRPGTSRMSRSAPPCSSRTPTSSRGQAARAAHHAGRRPLPRVAPCSPWCGGAPRRRAHAPARARHLGRRALRPDPAARRAGLQAALRERRVRKVYRALCAGHPAADAFTVDAPIGEVPLPAHRDGPRRHAGRPAVAQPRPGRWSGAGAEAASSLLEVEIETGRPHQIRIHLAFAGHPLVGDPLFGPGGLPLPGGLAVPGDPGYLLHALPARARPPPDRRAGGGRVRAAAGAAAPSAGGERSSRMDLRLAGPSALSDRRDGAIR